MKQFHLWALGGLLAGLAAPAVAASGAYARLDYLRFALLDLAPDDGATPSVSLILNHGYSDAEAGSSWRGDIGTFKPLNASVSGGEGSNWGASASVSPSGTLIAQGAAFEPGTGFEAKASTGTNGYEFRDFTYSLFIPAYSQLTISADVTTTVYALNGTCAYGNCESEKAWAEGRMLAWYSNDAVGVTSLGGERDTRVEATATGGYWLSDGSFVPPVDEVTDLVTTVIWQRFVNTGPLDQPLSLKLTVAVGGQAMTVVPEPDALALAGGGLALLAWRFRQRVGRVQWARRGTRRVAPTGST